ncbi:MAG: lysozyme, partial [Pseudomonadota bacterium]|nr:lysozyme [Pseudomonadota bacterium]
MTTAPQPKKRVSRQGLELIKSFEGLRRRAARLPNGRFVVGYGHIRSTREGAEIAPEDAEALLRYDLLPIEAALNEWALAPLTQNQFDALVSFAFNIGLASFRRSDVLRRINEGDLLRASAAMDTWRRVDLDGEPVIVDALVRRRAVEKALFLTPPGGQVPAPSAVLRPRVDTEAYTSVLLRRPEEIRTPFDGDDAVALRSEPTDEVGAEPETDEPELEFGPELVVSETTLIVPPGPDPELEPELVITETTVFVAPEEEPEAAAEDELPFAPDAELDPDFPAATEPAPEPEPEPEPVPPSSETPRTAPRVEPWSPDPDPWRFEPEPEPIPSSPPTPADEPTEAPDAAAAAEPHAPEPMAEPEQAVAAPQPDHPARAEPDASRSRWPAPTDELPDWLAEPV